MRKILLIISGIVFLSLGTNLVFADQATPSAKIKVDRLSNIIDRAKDRLTLFFIFSNKEKIKFQEELLERRLAEVEYVFNNNQGDLIEPVTARYQAYLGKFKDIVLKHKDNADLTEIRARLESHYQVFRYLAWAHQYQINSAFWLLLQNDSNVVQNFKDSL